MEENTIWNIYKTNLIIKHFVERVSHNIEWEERRMESLSVTTYYLSLLKLYRYSFFSFILLIIRCHLLLEFIYIYIYCHISTDLKVQCWISGFQPLIGYETVGVNDISGTRGRVDSL